MIADAQMNQLAARTLSAAEGLFTLTGPARPAIEASLPRRGQSNQALENNA